MNIEEYQFFQNFSVDFPDKDIIPNKLQERGENSQKTDYLNMQYLKQLQKQNDILTNKQIPWHKVNTGNLKDLKKVQMNQDYKQYSTLPCKFLQKQDTQTRITGLFIEPKQIAKDEEKMKYFLDQAYGDYPQQRLTGYIQHLKSINQSLKKKKDDIYNNLSQFSQYRQNEFIQKLEKIEIKVQQTNLNVDKGKETELNASLTLDKQKQMSIDYLNATSNEYNPLNYKYTVNKDLIEEIKKNNNQSFGIYKKNKKIIDYIQDRVQYLNLKGANTWEQNQNFLKFLNIMKTLIQQKRFKSLTKIFNKPKSYFEKIKKFNPAVWTPQNFMVYLNKKGNHKKKIQLVKRKYNKNIVSPNQVKTIHKELNNLNQIKGQVKKTNKDILCDIKQQGIIDAQNFQEIKQQIQMQYITAYRAIKQCNYVQLKSSYVIQDNPLLYQIHIRERLIYCTMLSLLQTTGLTISCLDEAYAHLDNGKQQMLGQKGKRVKWPQSDIQDKLGFLLSIDVEKQQGIQLVRNTGYNSHDIVTFLDENNKMLKNIQNHIFIMDNAASHVSSFTKRRTLASGMMILCNASRFPEGNPVEIIIGLMKREIPRFGLNITPEHMAESITRSFRQIHQTWLLGAYISAYQNCINFLEDIQKSSYFKI